MQPKPRKKYKIAYQRCVYESKLLTDWRKKEWENEKSEEDEEEEVEEENE